MKSVSRDTALLLFTLQTPNLLPRYALEALGEQCDSVIAQMSLDGILEAEVDGAMLSGPAAYELVFGESKQAESSSTLAALSNRALEYADALEILDPADLSARLYAYNRVAASAMWRRLLPDALAVEEHLGSGYGAMQLLGAGWTRLPQGPSDGWMAWQSRRASLARAGDADV